MDLDVKNMIKNQLIKRNIADKNVLEAMKKVPRHLFVSNVQRTFAYGDNPLPIGHEQTISQPYIVAFMTEVLDVQPHHTVLEIGTGCGYQTAVLSLLAKKVISLELIKNLADSAKTRLEKLQYNNIDIFCGNGKNGWDYSAPYDRIIATASPSKIPIALINQLDLEGKMILPVGPDVNCQYLQIITKNKKGFTQTKKSLPVRFVPMI